LATDSNDDIRVVVGGRELPQVDVTQRVTATLAITAAVVALWVLSQGCLPC